VSLASSSSASSSSSSDAVIGAGTVTSAALAHEAIAAGSRILVSPTMVPEVIEVAVEHDVAVVPGGLFSTNGVLRNDGDLREQDLILIDAGVELDTLYTADVTRTLPVGGRFTDEQRRVYEAVLAAQEAGIEYDRERIKNV